MMVIVCSPVMLGMKHNFDIQLQHIPRADEAVASAWLAFRNEQFWELTPNAVFFSTL